MIDTSSMDLKMSSKEAIKSVSFRKTPEIELATRGQMVLGRKNPVRLELPTAW